MTGEHAAYVRKETVISMVINGMISAGFAIAVFRGASSIGVWSSPSLALDFLPQTFAIAFFSVLVPSLLTRKRVKRGAVERKAASQRLPQNIILRALAVAVVSVVIIGGLAIVISSLVIRSELSFTSVMILKVAYGVVVAALITPFALHEALCEREQSRS